jgi:hypothetical protein
MMMTTLVIFLYHGFTTTQVFSNSKAGGGEMEIMMIFLHDLMPFLPFAIPRQQRIIF